MKIPDRFLGYAFCVGDILVELDLDFKILNADGAVNTILGSKEGSWLGKNVLAYFFDADQELIRRSSTTLSGQNRLGPIKVRLRTSSGQYEGFAVFLTKLPVNPDRLYMVISRQYRLGLKAEDETEPARPVAEKRSSFLQNMETLFSGDENAADNLLVTVMEAGASQDLTPENTAEIERYLSGFSLGGNNAAQLEDNKFAIIHERGEDTASDMSNEISTQLEAATGLQLSSATIDAKMAGLNAEDSVKALAFSLQQFANGNADFDIEALASDPAALLGETSEKINQFREILDKGDFSLVYQPIVDLASESVHHYEVLSRFNTKTSALSPFELITFAEDVGMISEFDIAVLNRTLHKLRGIRRHGAAPCLAVNVSGKSLSSADFMKEFTTTLKRNLDSVEFISIEITESAKISDLDTLADQLAIIRGLGFKVYLDDFGAGVSGFQYLRKLQVDALKIDGAYIKDALTSDMDRAFLRAMVSLCKELSITTVGEWVETKEHADLLRSMGVDYGQGYYFGKPTPGIHA